MGSVNKVIEKAALPSFAKSSLISMIMRLVHEVFQAPYGEQVVVLLMVATQHWG